MSHTCFQQSQSIAIYSQMKNEVDLSKLCDVSTNKSFYLPVIGKNNSMVFKHYDSKDRLIKNKYGISEPTSKSVINAADIDLCLVPLLGFNRKGSRLGMGGGFYDRYFEKNKFQKNPTILAGIAYDFQEDDTIQTESWDIPLDMIFTNKEVIYCG